MNQVKAISTALIVCCGLAACETVPAWKREHLARTEMAWTADPLEAQLADHIHFSKEAASGGGQAAGGGCGCN